LIWKIIYEPGLYWIALKLGNDGVKIKSIEMKTERRIWFKDKLKEQMQKIGVHRSQMADDLKLKRKTFYAYLEARAEPSVLTLKKFCLITGISVDEFLSDIPDEEV
jgi:hypothetical protein